MREIGLSGFLKKPQKLFDVLRKYYPLYTNSLESQNKATKKTWDSVTQTMQSWTLPGGKIFRGEIFYESERTIEHFISLQIIDLEKKQLIETAFPYLDYRNRIGQAAWPLVIMIIISFFFITLGFPLFFSGALLKPINELISGLKEINKNNFDVRVKVRVEDEIGFMSKSFNKMARSIKAGRMRLQKYAEQLEEKVQTRTQELQTTLEDVQLLKAQQDGDYFLTTLLLKPLGINEVKSDLIGIESFIRQKKKFIFRHWDTDIGGDINISHVIELEGKRYICFVNADAMGKSMQGAGGALVLGSVFHTIIERTKATTIINSQSPERWLKNMFIELHKVFESFDGSMLVAGFFALLDESAGLLYYLSAEHPDGVLYRNGKASFFGSHKVLRKLGTTGIHGNLQVYTLQMELGDVIIIGSDGRDDIMTGTTEDGERIINEDETQILRLIEAADADLKLLVSLIEQQGELIDDLSLMRIERFKSAHHQPPVDYKAILADVKMDLQSGDTQSAVTRIENYLKNDSFYPEAVKNLSQLYYQSHNYAKAAQYAQDYLWLRPADASFVYFASRCFRKIKDYKKSIDLSERLRLRDFPLAKNLALLCDLHIKMKNRRRAETILEELRSLEPSHVSIKILESKLALLEKI